MLKNKIEDALRRHKKIYKEEIDPKKFKIFLDELEKIFNDDSDIYLIFYPDGSRVIYNALGREYILEFNLEDDSYIFISAFKREENDKLYIIDQKINDISNGIERLKNYMLGNYRPE